MLETGALYFIPCSDGRRDVRAYEFGWRRSLAANFTSTTHAMMLYLRKPLTLLLALLTTLLGWRSVVDISSWDAQAVYRYGRGVLRPASEGILLSAQPQPSLRGEQMRVSGLSTR